jgi:hypothetical protein
MGPGTPKVAAAVVVLAMVMLRLVLWVCCCGGLFEMSAAKTIIRLLPSVFTTVVPRLERNASACRAANRHDDLLYTLLYIRRLIAMATGLAFSSSITSLFPLLP